MDQHTRLFSSSQPQSQPPLSSSSRVVGFFSKLLQQSRPEVVECKSEPMPSYSTPTRASLAKDMRVEMATKENIPPVGSSQWYGSTASSASDTTHASLHACPKRTVQRALTPVEHTVSRPASAPANTLSLTRAAEVGSDEALRRPLSELSKAEVTARRRESKSNSSASTKSPMSTKSAPSIRSLPSAKSPLSTKSAVSTKTAVSNKSALSTKGTPVKMPKTECVHKTRSLKPSTPSPVPSYAAPTSASRASATPAMRRHAKITAATSSPSKLSVPSPAKPAPAVRPRRNTLNKTPKSLRVSTAYNPSDKGSPSRRAEAWALTTAVPSSPRRRCSATPSAQDPLRSPLSPKLPGARTLKAVEHARAKLAGDKAAMRDAKVALEIGIQHGQSPATLRVVTLSKIGANDTPRRTAHMTPAAVGTVSMPTKRALSTLQAKAGAKREARALLKASRNRVNGNAMELIAAAQAVLGGAVRDLEESRSPEESRSAPNPLEAAPEAVCCKCRGSLAEAESSASMPSETILIPSSPPRPAIPPFLAGLESLAAQLARRRSSLSPLGPGLPSAPPPPTPPSALRAANAPIAGSVAADPKPMQALLHATPAMLQAAVQGLKHVDAAHLPVPSAGALKPADADVPTTSQAATVTSGTATVSALPVSTGLRLPPAETTSPDHDTPRLAPADMIRNARFGLKPVGNAHGAAVRNARR
ncbi:hypothetical protein CspeluHIS016_0302640 [Cutaneotrichosporon spelunceum]|uniref:Uncharacterized protein n=1 Tax=Cutaneotrichosporon spelunceum TaxID=1672016 RepID=A0AAD3YC35_9TREE|nr:hypothetical protein CspeluHIS016_0302640 [Cutaneotrichosporon spelunceum]